MKLIAHMGLPKTGSTAVQSWLWRRSPDLAKHGIVAPRSIGADHGNCVEFIEAMLDSANGNSPLFDAFSNDIDQARAADARAILISSEEFGHYMRSPQQLALIQKRLARLGKTLDLGVVFLRNPQDLLNSSYAQIVKAGPFPMAFDAFLEYWTENQVYNFDRNFLNLRAAGIDVRAGVFPSTLSMPERTIQLAGLEGVLPLNFDYSVTRQNESIGEIGVLLSRMVWAHAPFDTLDSANRSRVAGQIVLACAGFKDRTFNGFTKHTLKKSKTYFVPILDAVRSDLADDDYATLLLNQLGGVPTSRTSIRDLSQDERSSVQVALDQISNGLRDLMTPEQTNTLRAAAG